MISLDSHRFLISTIMFNLSRFLDRGVTYGKYFCSLFPLTAASPYHLLWSADFGSVKLFVLVWQGRYSLMVQRIWFSHLRWSYLCRTFAIVIQCLQ